MTQPQGLPAALASRQRRSVLTDAVAGLGMARGPHISIRGGRFRLIAGDGTEKLIDTHYLDLIVIDASANTSRVFFEGEFDPSADLPPTCFSDNGSGPSNKSMAPQSPTCVVCPWNVRGSDQTFTGKATTACSKRKKLGVIIPDDPAVTVYEFQIPPGSLSNLTAYGDWIRKQASGTPGRNADIADFVTRVSFDPAKQFVMVFQPVAFADDERTLQVIEYIDANKLSDEAVGRNDVAFAPEQVTAMLAGQPAAPALPPPAAAAPAQQFTLPPRQQQAPAQLPPPPAEPAQPAAPRGRRRAVGGQAPAAPASAAPAAPFMAPATPQFQAPPAAPAATLPQQDGLQIPDFLKRNPTLAPAVPAAPTPRFGMVDAPPPPPGVADALNSAMSLPTRR